MQAPLFLALPDAAEATKICDSKYLHHNSQNFRFIIFPVNLFIRKICLKFNATSNPTVPLSVNIQKAITMGTPPFFFWFSI